MNRLRELHREFREALLDASATLRHSRLVGDQGLIDTRLAIYRNNVFTNLREALRTFYPVVNRLVGVTCFDYCADAYIRRYPSPAGDLNQFGEHLGLFLSTFETVIDLHYLPDVARLEWLAHRVYHAADALPLNLTRLARVDPADYGQLRFRLHPACALFASEYPVHRIWRVNQAGFNGDDHVDLRTGGVNLLITRRGHRIELQALSTGTWVLLTALAANTNFATASHLALQCEPALDLSATLTRLISGVTLVDVSVSDQPLVTEPYHPKESFHATLQ